MYNAEQCSGEQGRAGISIGFILINFFNNDLIEGVDTTLIRFPGGKSCQDNKPSKDTVLCELRAAGQSPGSQRGKDGDGDGVPPL